MCFVVDSGLAESLFLHAESVLRYNCPALSLTFRPSDSRSGLPSLANRFVWGDEGFLIGDGLRLDYTSCFPASGGFYHNVTICKVANIKIRLNRNPLLRLVELHLP